MDLNLRRSRGKGGKLPLPPPEDVQRDREEVAGAQPDLDDVSASTLALARTERNDDDQQLALRDDVQRRDIDLTVGDEPQRDDVLGAQTTLVVGSEIVAGLGSARESDSGELPGPVIRELADVGSSGTHEPSSRGLFETAGFARRQPDRTTGQDVGQVANEGSVTPDFLALVATTQGAHEGGRGEAPPNPFWDQGVQDE